MSLQSGARLGPYEVVSALGSGGMGEVYRARDTKLNRDVAIKVLPDVFALDADRLARFTREAQVLASLNHPNIAQIYGIEESTGAEVRGFGGSEVRPSDPPPTRALVMELVEGEDLSVSLANGPMALADALPLAKQIADALEAAHEQGIVHRDLKPANIKVRADGTIKVLDFGLAKAIDPHATSGAEPMNSPTMTARATQMGMIIGTAAYMAPEQAKGRAVDKRADIWAFGVVLYEMLTGRRLFEAEDTSETLAAVLTRDVGIASLPGTIPPRVRALLRDCLVRDPRQRLRDIGDARRILEQVISGAPDPEGPETAAGGTPAALTTSARSPKTAGVAALLVVAGAVAGVGLWTAIGLGRGNPAGITQPVRLSISVPSSIHLEAGRITSDGSVLVFRGVARRPDGTFEARRRLYRRSLGAYEFTAIPGTEGVQSFALSPDRTQAAFSAPVSEQSSQRRIAKIPLDGSTPPVPIADWDVAWDESFVWLESGDLLIGTSRGTQFFRLPTNGGPPTPPVTIDTGAIAGFPVFGNVLPGDRGVFFTMDSWGSRGYQMDQWLLDLATGKAQRLFEGAANATYLETGHVVFSRGPVLLAAPFDPASGAVTGDIMAFPGTLRTEFSWSHGLFVVAGNGTLVAPEGGLLGTDRHLIVADSTGQSVAFTTEARAYEAVIRASPDGRRAAVVVPTPKGTYETWIADLDRPGLRRVLSLPNADAGQPVWSPDSKWLAYQRTARDAEDGLYLQRLDGTGTPQVLFKPPPEELGLEILSWEPQGSGVIIRKIADGRGDLLLVPVTADGVASEPRPLRVTPADEGPARFSPDGRFVAFGSDESGRPELYVSAYEADGTLGPPLLVSNGVSRQLAWAADSRRLFYGESDTVMMVTLTTGPRLSASAPVQAFDLRKLRVKAGEWDILPDGRLLGIEKGQGEDDITVFNVTLNWLDELRARMTKQ